MFQINCFSDHFWPTTSVIIFGQGLFCVDSLKMLLKCSDLKLTSLLHWQFHITHVFFRIFKVGACCITGQWGEFTINNATLCLHILFRQFFCLFVCLFVFHQKVCIFIIFIYFFDKASNFRSRVLTNQKPELVIRIVSGNVCCRRNS